MLGPDVSRTVFFGLGRQGEVKLTELLGDSDLKALTAMAQARLEQFHKVEVWVQSVCVVRLRRAP